MTVKQLAAELNTSKTTIKNIMRKLNISPQKKMDRGQEVIFLSESEIEQIKKRFLENHPAESSGNPTENVSGKGEKFTENPTEKSEKQTENTEKSTENTEKIEENKISGQLIDILRQDLEIKNKQIEDLNNRLAEAMKALDQEQQLKAIAEKRILELEDKAAAATIGTIEEPKEKEKVEEPEEPKEPKKGFFSWLKKKWQ